MSDCRAQSRRSRKLGLDFVAVRGIRGVMSNENKPPPEDIIAKLMLAAGLLMEETSPELATPIDPTRDALEARIAVVERAAEQLGSIATTARAVVRLIQP